MTTPQATRSLVVPALLVVALSGCMVAAQGRLNGDLSTAGAGVLVASWLSYLGTVAVVAVVVAVSGGAARTVRTLRDRGRWWWYAVGLLGVPIVLGFAFGIPIVGVAVASVCAVAGQIVAGLTLDARGVGVPLPLPLTGRRLVGALAAVVGLGLGIVAASRPEVAGPVEAVGIGLLLFVGGLAIAGQVAGNGRVTQLSGDPLVAALASASGGMAAMTAIVAVAAAAGGLSGVALPDEPGQWYLYLGGPLGAGITVAAAWGVRHLGTFALTLATVGGQLVAALVVDLVVGAGTHWSTLVAVVAIAAATVLGVAPRREAVSRPEGEAAPGP